MDLKQMHKNRGQALPIGLALLLVISVIATVLFNTGQSVSEKTRVVNAADAASYSGLLWQSRALNFMAYTNRAMVANQVAMAQAVSINSWASYAEITVSNLDKYLKAIPYVGAVVSVVKSVVSGVEAFISPISEAMLATVNGINTVLSGAQQAMFLTSFAATPEVVNIVIRANDPRFEWETAFSMVELGKNLASWNSFTDRFTNADKAHMQERANIIEASLDPFSRDRSWDFFKQWIPTSPLTSVRVEKRGATKLIRSKDGKNYEWKAKDNVSLNTKVFGFWNKKKIIELPIGYAEAYARYQGSGSSLEQCSSSTLCQDWFGTNTTAQFMGQEFNANDMSSHYSGIRAFRVLSDSIREGEELASLNLSVEVVLPLKKFAQSLPKPSKRFYKSLDIPGHKLTSISAAQLFYERPDEIYSGQSEYREYATAYNPFWDVRLGATSTATKLALYAVRNKNGGATQPKLALLGTGRVATPLSDYEQQQALLPSEKRQRLIQKITELNGSSNTDVLALAMSLSNFDEALTQMDNLRSFKEARWQGVLSKYGNLSSINKVIEKQVKTALKKVLNSAVNNILSGLIKKLGVDASLATDLIANEVKEELDTLLNEGGATALEQQINQASEDIDRLAERYQEIRETVIERFSQAAEAATLNTIALVESLRNEKELLLEELANTLNEERRAVILKDIRNVSYRIKNAPEKQIETLAKDLQKLVADLMPNYPLNYADAKSAVIASLKVNGSSIADLLNIIDIADANDNH